MRVIVTGSRNWNDWEKVWESLNLLFLDQGPLILIHGGCPTGADAAADLWAFGHQVHTVTWVADWKKHGKAAGPIRNQEMVDSGADLVLAFPLGESRGTRHCMKVAEKAGIPVINCSEEE